jgi:hypothetical protein
MNPTPTQMPVQTLVTPNGVQKPNWNNASKIIITIAPNQPFGNATQHDPYSAFKDAAPNAPSIFNPSLSSNVTINSQGSVSSTQMNNTGFNKAPMVVDTITMGVGGMNLNQQRMGMQPSGMGIGNSLINANQGFNNSNVQPVMSGGIAMNNQMMNNQMMNNQMIFNMSNGMNQNMMRPMTLNSGMTIPNMNAQGTMMNQGFQQNVAMFAQQPGMFQQRPGTQQPSVMNTFQQIPPGFQQTPYQGQTGYNQYKQ